MSQGWQNPIGRILLAKRPSVNNSLDSRCYGLTLKELCDLNLTLVKPRYQRLLE